jgi:simple sugar transport system permease protein
VTVIGGTLLSGGYGSVIGTILGSITFGMIQVGLVLAGAPGHFFKTLTGAIVVAAVILNTDVARRLSRSRPLAGFRRNSAAADAAIAARDDKIADDSVTPGEGPPRVGATGDPRS